MPLQSAYFEDFKGGPKLLFWGDAKAMSDLACLLRKSSVEKESLALDAFSEAVDKKPIVIRTVSASVGMRRCGSGFEWCLNPDAMIDFADMIDVLARAALPGHQYLECGDADEIVVMASAGEYPVNLSPYS